MKNGNNVLNMIRKEISEADNLEKIFYDKFHLTFMETQILADISLAKRNSCIVEIFIKHCPLTELVELFNIQWLKICPSCGKAFENTGYSVDKGEHIYCSLDCLEKSTVKKEMSKTV